MNGLVSVIITNYNYGIYLKNAIDSVLNQSYQNFEIIIADDGSTDDSRKIIKEYERKDSRIKGLFLLGRGGQNAAFMKGAEMARGEIISCLDADDWYCENMLQYKVEMHSKYPDCAMVDSQLSIDGVTRMVCARKDFDYGEALRKFGYLYAHNTTSGLSIRRDYLNRFLPFSNPEEMKAGLDCVLVHIALAASNIVVDERICGRYREHSQAVYSEKQENQNGGFPTYIRKLKRYARRQVAQKGIIIPDNDEMWYHRIIQMQFERIHNKRIEIYGTSEISKCVIRELERLKEEIVFITDRRETRRNYEANNVFEYPWIPAEDIAHVRGREYNRYTDCSFQTDNSHRGVFIDDASSRYDSSVAFVRRSVDYEQKNNRLSLNRYI